MTVLLLIIGIPALSVAVALSAGPRSLKFERLSVEAQALVAATRRAASRALSGYTKPALLASALVATIALCTQLVVVLTGGAFSLAAGVLAVAGVLVGGSGAVATIRLGVGRGLSQLPAHVAELLDDRTQAPRSRWGAAWLEGATTAVIVEGAGALIVLFPAACILAMPQLSAVSLDPLVGLRILPPCVALGALCASITLRRAGSVFAAAANASGLHARVPLQSDEPRNPAAVATLLGRFLGPRLARISDQFLTSAALTAIPIACGAGLHIAAPERSRDALLIAALPLAIRALATVANVGAMLAGVPVASRRAHAFLPWARESAAAVVAAVGIVGCILWMSPDAWHELAVVGVVSVMAWLLLVPIALRSRPGEAREQRRAAEVAARQGHSLVTLFALSKSSRMAAPPILFVGGLLTFYWFAGSSLTVAPGSLLALLVGVAAFTSLVPLASASGYRRISLDASEHVVHLDRGAVPAASGEAPPPPLPASELPSAASAAPRSSNRTPEWELGSVFAAALTALTACAAVAMPAGLDRAPVAELAGGAPALPLTAISIVFCAAAGVLVATWFLSSNHSTLYVVAREAHLENARQRLLLARATQSGEAEAEIPTSPPRSPHTAVDWAPPGPLRGPSSTRGATAVAEQGDGGASEATGDGAPFDTGVDAQNALPVETQGGNPGSTRRSAPPVPRYSSVVNLLLGQRFWPSAFHGAALTLAPLALAALLVASSWVAAGTPTHQSPQPAPSAATLGTQGPAASAGRATGRPQLTRLGSVLPAAPRVGPALAVFSGSAVALALFLFFLSRGASFSLSALRAVVGEDDPGGAQGSENALSSARLLICDPLADDASLLIHAVALASLAVAFLIL